MGQQQDGVLRHMVYPQGRLAPCTAAGRTRVAGGWRCRAPIESQHLLARLQRPASLHRGCPSRASRRLFPARRARAFAAGSPLRTAVCAVM